MTTPTVATVVSQREGLLELAALLTKLPGVLTSIMGRLVFSSVCILLIADPTLSQFETARSGFLPDRTAEGTERSLGEEGDSCWASLEPALFRSGREVREV